MNNATLVIASGVLVVVGIFLLILGRRGRRINLHDACRRCGHDLSGVELRTACSECGSDLRLPSAVRRGVRTRRPRFVISGILALALGFAALWPVTQRVAWIEHAPVWWLAMKLRDPATAMPYITEANRRLAIGELNQTQAQRLAAIGLDQQADPNIRWVTTWGDFIEGAHDQDLLSKGQFERYLRQTVVEGFMFKHQLLVRHGSKITMRVEPPPCRTSHLIQGSQYALTFRILTFKLGEQEIPSTWGMVNHLLMFHRPWVMRGSGPQIAADLSPGMYPITVRFRAGIIETRTLEEQRLRPGAWPMGTLVEWEQEIQSQIKVVPAETSLVEVVDNPAFLEVVRQGIRIESGQIELYRHDDGSIWGINGMLRIIPPPMDIAWRPSLEIDGQRWPMHGQAIGAGWQDAFFVLGFVGGRVPDNFPRDASQCRIILQSDVQTAEESIDIGNRILGGEIVLEDVPIR